MTSGLLLLDKPAGLSSAQAIAKVKKKLQCRKIGHAGTLDPDATGLLICLLGGATKFASYAEAGEKVYSGVMTLGVRTGTDDLSGEVLTRHLGDLPDVEQTLRAVAELTGKLFQKPPKVSSVKVSGKRAYKLAREGVEFELRLREVTVHEFTIQEITLPDLSFRIRCSKGTYIRSLARDLGEKLGCGGALKTLRREASFPFDCACAKSIDEVSESDILHWSELFPGRETYFFDERLFAAFRNGHPGARRELERDLSSLGDSVFLSFQDEKPFGLAIFDGAEWKIVSAADEREKLKEQRSEIVCHH